MLPTWQETGADLSPSVADVATRKAHLFIEEHLRAAGLSDEAAADKLGLPRTTVYRWRRMQSRLNPQKIQLLADLIGVQPGDLWRMPGNFDINAILDHADQDTKMMVADIAMRLAKKKSTT